MTIRLTTLQGDDIRVHAADCADLKKAATRRAAYNGQDTITWEDGTSERDVWIEFNIDFLEEGGADAAWPLVFLPCTHEAGLVKDSDRSWEEN